MAKNLFGNVQLERKPAGAFLIEGQVVAHTLQCCHCNGHFVSVKGSGIRRGFCTRCHHVTCGNPRCDPCIPFEEQLKIMEGRPSPYMGVMTKQKNG